MIIFLTKNPEIFSGFFNEFIQISPLNHQLLNIKPEMHDITILHNIFLSFNP
jgi:hypothetical protein